jgi:hypothetical protein
MKCFRKFNLFIYALVLHMPFPGHSQSQNIIIDERDRIETIEQVIKIDQVWAGHPVGFCLLTEGEMQYVAYYNADRHMVVGQRNLLENKFDLHVVPPKERTPEDRTSTVLDWDSHNSITMAVDKDGYIHLAGNMHVHPITYFRSTRPWDIASLVQIRNMVGTEEDRCTYPRFMKMRDGRLVFHYRDGGSGRGNEIYNVYSTDTRQWSRLLDTPLLDGQGEMNAYASQPRLDKDGWYHMFWVWRDTPDCETNHDLSYVKSPDLINWYNALGDPVSLPVTFADKSVIVDPIPAGGGIINLAARLCLDENLKPVFIYHKYDLAGNLQLYVARLENGKWSYKQITNWDYRWEFKGRGSINFEVRLGSFTRRADGNYEMGYSHIKYGDGTFLLDRNFDIVGEVKKPQSTVFNLESTFPDMHVRASNDIGPHVEPGFRYMLKWETLSSNRDRPRPKPWPEPSQLYLYKLKTAESEWQKMVSVEDVVATYPDRIKNLFQNLDLDRKGLKKVKTAYRKGDISAACTHLLEHYKTSASKRLFSVQRPQVSHKTIPSADSLIRDLFTFYQLPDRVPRLEDGRLDWTYSGPDDDIEWAWATNRHFVVRDLLQAWHETGNPKYARYIDKFIKDWIISSHPYPGVRSTTAMWRGLEVSFRVKYWAQAFYSLMDDGYLSPATQLLILSSLPEHAHYARNFHAQNNWLTMEISGLATVATAWPELKEASEWLKYSIGTMVESIKGQVYPDGAQTELASSYHYVALNNFNQLLEICNKVNASLPEYYTKTVENMWNYLAYTIRPDGYGLLNNNSDKRYNRDLVLNAALTYNRDDWKYIASNGNTGVKPTKSPSILFPWAGHLISRSGFGTDAHWSFFDIGPWGSAHQHNDKLHLSISAYGRDLLVDAGRFAYRGEVANKFRRYALSSQSHNLILIDGKGQDPGPRLAEQPLTETEYKIADDFDYASSSFESFIDLDGKAVHNRSLFYVRGRFWVVVDHISTDRPRKIEALWHWHPNCIVQQENNGIVATNNPRGNLKIIPVGNHNWNIDLVKGQDDPVQGWYSKEYNLFEPNVAAIYSDHIDADKTYVWVLLPSEGSAPEVNAEVVSVGSDSVNVKVTMPGIGFWNISIPFMNSTGARLQFVPAKGM